MEKHHETALTQMRKSIEKLGSSPQKYGDPTLMRFLIARSMDAEKAAKMLVNWETWRAEFVPLGFIPETEVSDELNSRKMFLQGVSKQGYSVLLIKTSRHFPNSDHLQFKKFAVHLLDKTVACAFKEGKEIGNEKLVGIIDLANISYKNIDTRGTISGFQFCQSYYPERLAKCYILSMPRFFVNVWKMVSRFLDKATREKVMIVSTKGERDRFIKELGEDVVPEEYGGRGKLVAIQDVNITYFPIKEGTS